MIVVYGFIKVLFFFAQTISTFHFYKGIKKKRKQVCISATTRSSYYPHYTIVGNNLSVGRKLSTLYTIIQVDINHRKRSDDDE
jgi:hypothetical protein